MSWFAGRRSAAEVLAARSPLGEQVAELCSDAAAAAPGRTALIITARVEQLICGRGSLTAFEPLSPAEAVVMEVTDRFLADAHAIDDDLMHELSQHYSPDEQVGLLFHLAMADGFTRLAHTFAVTPTVAG